LFELCFLGTSASAPSVERNMTSTLLIHDGKRYLLDCAEGTQRQILRSGLGFKDLRRILLTHGHLDHILGLGGIVSTFGRWEAIARIEIYAGKWALDRVRDLIKVVLRGKEVEMDIEFIEVKPGILFEEKNLTVSAFPVIHRGSGCFAYVFQEKTKRPFLVEQAEALGVPAGPERRRLVAGEALTLADGRVILPDQVLGAPVPGTKLVYVGDIARTDEVRAPARDADALVMEATYVAEDVEIARQFGHITGVESARCARDANARMLYLTHISRRYSGALIGEQARAIFPNTIVANDLDRAVVKRD
jgi:ribonuclease Z